MDLFLTNMNHTPLALATLTLLSLSSLATAAPKPKLPEAGGYFGLVTGADFANSGCISVTVSSKGSATVALKIGAEKSSLVGQIDPETKQFVLKTGVNNPYALNFAISGSGDSLVASGELTVGEGVVPFTAPASNRDPKGPNVPAKGMYNAVYEGLVGAETVVETTAGIATLRVLPKGKIQLKSILADASVLPTQAQVSGDGSVRFWLPIGKDGALTGTLQFTNDASSTKVAGSLNWFKPLRAGKKYYPDAFDTALTVLGSSYVKADPILDFSETDSIGQLSIDLGNLSEPVVVEGTLSSKNQFTISGDDGVKLNFNRGIGLASGKLQDASSGAKASFSGVVLQSENVARGIVFGADTTGEFLLEAKPAAVEETNETVETTP